MDVKKAVDLVKKSGRSGDTQLVHVTAREIAALKKMGGRGTVNPKTGLLEFAMDSASSKGVSRGGNGAVGSDGKGDVGEGGGKGGGGGGSSKSTGATAGGVLSGAAKGAMTGASIGGNLGPAGAAVGAAVGGVIGGVRAAGLGSFGGFGGKAAAAGAMGPRGDTPNDQDLMGGGKKTNTSGSNSSAQGNSNQNSQGQGTYNQPKRRRGSLGNTYSGGLQRPTLLGV